MKRAVNTIIIIECSQKGSYEIVPIGEKLWRFYASLGPMMTIIEYGVATFIMICFGFCMFE